MELDVWEDSALQAATLQANLHMMELASFPQAREGHVVLVQLLVDQLTGC